MTLIPLPMASSMEGGTTAAHSPVLSFGRMPRGPTLAGSIPLLDLGRVETSMSAATEWAAATSARLARPEGGWSTERLTHRPMDPISLKRSKLAGEIEVMHHSERGPTPLPIIKGLRSRSIALRTDGRAAMIPTLQVYPSNGLSELR